jgi:predicted nucleic acid-binding protein
MIAAVHTRRRRANEVISVLRGRLACVAFEYDAMLLTRNTVDFAKVPRLKFANRLD